MSKHSSKTRPRTARDSAAGRREQPHAAPVLHQASPEQIAHPKIDPPQMTREMQKKAPAPQKTSPAASGQVPVPPAFQQPPVQAVPVQAPPPTSQQIPRQPASQQDAVPAFAPAAAPRQARPPVVAAVSSPRAVPSDAEEASDPSLTAIWQGMRHKRISLTRKFRRVRRRARHVIREEKAHRFPESDRVLVQFFLFARNILPRAGTVLSEHKWGQHKRSVALLETVRTKFEQKKVHPLRFFAGASVLVALILFCSLYTIGTTVSYNGEVIAAVESVSAANKACAQLEQITTRAIGTEYTIDQQLLQYSSGLMPRSEVVDVSVLEEDLSQEIGLVTYGYSLYVDGELIGSTSYEGALDELLTQLRAGIMDENTISCEFKETVEIKAGYIPTEQITNLGYLAETLYSTKTAEVTYTVKAGDIWSKIANSRGLTSNELLALNPGYNPDRLAIGEVLTLSASVPYLTMTVVEQERYLQDIPYDIEYTDTADLYKDDYRVTSAGSYGSADVVANVTYVNGEEQSRTILSSVTLKNPVTEQQLRGTKERPTWLPTGTFRWPCSGRITSRFGYRNLSYSYASTNHKGIDIANRYGTAVCAADGGTVTYAGWMSGYGYLVRINHGNGYETYYGHNSSLIVSVGDKVYKGQQLARMGSTGNSTGNHCHFEVRYNGVARNPLNYLP